MISLPRSSGILLHPTSLPGDYGIGDLGDSAFRFVDWLEAQGQSIWQVLPLGPTSYGDSPYQTLSAFAGNANLISLGKLVEDGLLCAGDLADVPPFPRNRVDYGWIIPYHNQKLALAQHKFVAGANPLLKHEYEEFVSENSAWLDDFALFVALKRQHKLRPWTEWETPLLRRDQMALEEARKSCNEAIKLECFRQWLFYRQWAALKAYANSKGMSLIGDLPIFVAHDSADVWANQHEYFWTRVGIQRSSPVCLPITSAPPGSAGAIRSIAGISWRARAINGGFIVCKPC